MNPSPCNNNTGLKHLFQRVSQHSYIRIVQLVFWEQGFDKVRESSRTLELFEGFDVEFWETGPWAPPPTFKTSQLDVYDNK